MFQQFLISFRETNNAHRVRMVLFGPVCFTIVFLCIAIVTLLVAIAFIAMIPISKSMSESVKAATQAIPNMIETLLYG